MTVYDERQAAKARWHAAKAVASRFVEAQAPGIKVRQDANVHFVEGGAFVEAAVFVSDYAIKEAENA